MLEEGLGGWWFLPTYFEQDLAGKPHEWSMTMLSGSLRGGMFHHELTETCLGGAFGVKWAALALLRAHWCFQQMRSGRLPPQVTELSVDVDVEAEIVMQDVDWLIREIETSVRMLHHARERRIDRAWTTVLIDMPQFRRAGTLSEHSPSVSDFVNELIMELRLHRTPAPAVANGPYKVS
jgi:hypothetical protein